MILKLGHANLYKPLSLYPDATIKVILHLGWLQVHQILCLLGGFGQHIDSQPSVVDMPVICR